ncbi:TolC family protein [Salinisphaera aquimarina]|uniref:TolC family protein n=1 Tax=Salinisphaera aquimarina TaxID=2094031 RepID=A0ABV7EK37_9GAMM
MGLRCALGLMLALGVSACAHQQYQPAPLDPAATAKQFDQRRLDAAELLVFMKMLGAQPDHWPLPRWTLDDLFLAALYYQPDLDVDRGEWRARLAAERQAGQRTPLRINPQVEHHSEADNESAWTVGTLIEFVIPGPGKRAAREDAAAARAEGARLRLGEGAWAVRERLEKAALTLANQQRLAQLADIEREQTARALDILQRRLDQGVTDAAAVTSMRLRLQRARLAAGQARHQAGTAEVDLATAIGVPVEAIAAVAQRLVAPDSALPGVPAPAIRETALTHRYDIRRALADYGAADAALRGAIADQYPDITLSPGFLFDQADRVWVLEASWLLLLPRHNAAPIAAARAERDAAAARFRRVQARAIADVDRARADYVGARDVLRVAERVLAAQQRQAADTRQRVEVGYSDRLSLVTARIETIAARRARAQAQFDARRALTAMESAIEARLPVGTRQLDPVRRFVALGADEPDRSTTEEQGQP